MFDAIRNKRVLITGSGSGMGSCTAELFASYGAVVGIHYNTNNKSAKTLADRISSGKNRAVLLQADLLKESERDKLIPSFIELTGGIDVLINNAGGIIGPSHFLELDGDSWNMTINLNLTAPFFLSRAAFSFMKGHGGGRIINISSIASKYGGSEISTHYGAAKAGLDALTRTLARAGAHYNILVNSIQPGVIDTDFHRKMGRASLDDRVGRIPLKRAGNPVDVARLCLFLASECGDYITGQVYGITGGD
jgi:NAD(P)-dependent dehydrogenase (short-subunit alcohol dehydrogenase family)